MNAQLIKLALLAVAAVAGQAHADADTGFYAGAGLGQGVVNVDCTGSDTCHSSDVGYKVMGGYRFTTHLAAEGGYLKFGHGKTGLGANYYSIEPKGFFAGGAARYALMPSWTAIGRLGAVQLRTTTEDVTGAVRTLTSNTKFKPMWGLGLNYSLDEDAALELSWDSSKAEASNGVSQRVNLWAANLFYTF